MTEDEWDKYEGCIRGTDAVWIKNQSEHDEFWLFNAISNADMSLGARLIYTALFLCVAHEKPISGAALIAETMGIRLDAVANYVAELRRHGYLQPQMFSNINMGARDYILPEIGKNSDWTCVYCGMRGAEDRGPDGRVWHIDHLFAKANGGDSLSDNLILACATCNLRKNRDLASEILHATHQRVVQANSSE